MTRVLRGFKAESAVKLGDLAQYVLDKRIPLEICLLSNAHTGATPSLAEHPFKILYQEKFRVTLNTDNRLMSHTTMSQGFDAAAVHDLLWLSLRPDLCADWTDSNQSRRGHHVRARRRHRRHSGRISALGGT